MLLSDAARLRAGPRKRRRRRREESTERTARIGGVTINLQGGSHETGSFDNQEVKNVVKTTVIKRLYILSRGGATVLLQGWWYSFVDRCGLRFRIAGREFRGFQKSPVRPLPV